VLGTTSALSLEESIVTLVRSASERARSACAAAELVSTISGSATKVQCLGKGAVQAGLSRIHRLACLLLVYVLPFARQPRYVMQYMDTSVFDALQDLVAPGDAARIIQTVAASGEVR
jgi:hypothetical protein